MQPGEQVPDFEAMLEDGRSVRLTTLLGDGPIVLFFYPKAFTPGCTAEACHFRDLAQEFDRVGAQRFGVSRDQADTQARFVEEHGLDYPLIADPDGRVAKIFGAKRLGPIWSKRQTFVVGTDRTLLGVIASETDMERHADEALQLLQEQMA
jgi:thioredoxin-dependent peroxiredoxin